MSRALSLKSPLWGMKGQKGMGNTGLSKRKGAKFADGGSARVDQLCIVCPKLVGDRMNLLYL